MNIRRESGKFDFEEDPLVKKFKVLEKFLMKHCC